MRSKRRTDFRLSVLVCMLLHDPSPRLRDRIVAHLSVNAPISVENVHAAIIRRGHRYSLKAVYKELAILVTSGIVIRSKGYYQLSLAWVFDVVSYTDSLVAQIEQQTFGSDLLPEQGKHRTWKLYEHAHVDRLWAQVTGVLLTKLENPVIYQALQHRWWPLLHQNLGRQYRQVMKKTAATSLFIIGGDTYLDRLFMSYFPKSPSRCLIVPEFFDELQDTGLTVVGDYIIKTVYPKVFLNELDQYFNRIKSLKAVLVSDVQNLFRSTGVITFRIEHNQGRALKLRKIFDRYLKK